MPDYYNDKYEEQPPSDKVITNKIILFEIFFTVKLIFQPRRAKREVIVHRVDTGRGDEWADPWMRSKSPGGRGKPATRYSGGGGGREGGGGGRRSYSSGSSYSSSR